MQVALIGNQNCGKTTLFNALTGSHQHVGNFPGVTVEKKEGNLRGYKDVQITDLPGIYSLSPYTTEERVTRDFLLKEKPDLILNIVDAVNLERNLYLSLQLLELERPMILALNLMDEVRARGGEIRHRELEAALGVPVVPISALKGEGLSELIRRIRQKGNPAAAPDIDTGSLGQVLKEIRHITEAKAKAKGWPPVFAASRILEGEKEVIAALKLTEEEKKKIERKIKILEGQRGMDREAMLADGRYRFIEELCRRYTVKSRENRRHTRSYSIDRLLTHRYLGIPIFLVIMGGIFWMTFQGAGAWLRRGMEEGINWCIQWLGEGLEGIGAAGWLQSLILDGICAGVGSVLSFLPVILVLFFLLSLLEDSGYMARVAFVMDRILGKIGLSGRSFVPLLIGFGCSVPAIMATRTLSSERDRRMTILLIPFISCSAKLPIYGLLSQTFFPEQAGWVTLGIYGLGVGVMVLTGWLMTHTRYRGRRMPFVLELPEYRLPGIRSLLLHMEQRAGDFLHKVFSTILLASVAVWFLGHFDGRLQYTTLGEQSILAAFGAFLTPVFRPLGFGDWRAATALLTGLMAKESVVSTLTVLTGAVSSGGLGEALSGMLSPAAALSFLSFTALYMPCVAAFGAARRELGSGWKAIGNSLFQTGIAYGTGIFVYFIACRMI